MLRETLEILKTEIGEIIPVPTEEGSLVFEHPLYPRVFYEGDTAEEVISGYKRILNEFIKARIAGELSPDAERATSGRGGKRPGAGRPTGTTKGPRTTNVRVSVVVRDWLKDPKNKQKLEEMAGS